MLGRLKNKFRHKGPPPPYIQSPLAEHPPPGNAVPPLIGSAPPGTSTSVAPVSNQTELFALTEEKASSDKTSEPVDVVAIHGLGGNPYLTWTHPETGHLWLRDTLPSYISDGRVYTFGYA